MALTNYLTATLLVLAAGHILGLPIGRSSTVAYLAAGAILIAQWLCSALWLRRYRQGPLEWLWRWATWARRPPLRRSPERHASTAPGRALGRERAEGAS
jgi:uncharacterized membrane protein YeiB